MAVKRPKGKPRNRYEIRCKSTDVCLSQEKSGRSWTAEDGISDGGPSTKQPRRRSRKIIEKYI